jgi:thiol:disulfide interchange protein DsbC
MRTSAFLAALGIATFLGLPAAAQDADQVKAALKKKLPEAPIDSVRKVPYGGLYEVTAGGDVLYTDANTSFLFMGSIVDLKTKENVTEARMRQVNAIKFEQLPLDSAIKIQRGNGSRKVAIFEDPHCGYCKRFERDLQGISDITVYVFLYPILSQDSIEKSKAIWCSADPGKAWLDAMLRESFPSSEANCANPIDRNLALGRDKRITGTPTLIFENGERVPGAMPIAEFEKKLAAAKLPPPTASSK